MTAIKPTLANVKKMAAEMGARFIDNTGCGVEEYALLAPHHKVWACDGIHMLYVGVNGLDYPPTKQLRAEAFADAIERMQYGLEDCEIPDCEDCAEWHQIGIDE